MPIASNTSGAVKLRGTDTEIDVFTIAGIGAARTRRHRRRRTGAHRGGGTRTLSEREYSCERRSPPRHSTDRRRCGLMRPGDHRRGSLCSASATRLAMLVPRPGRRMTLIPAAAVTATRPVATNTPNNVVAGSGEKHRGRARRSSRMASAPHLQVFCFLPLPLCSISIGPCSRSRACRRHRRRNCRCGISPAPRSLTNVVLPRCMVSAELVAVYADQIADENLRGRR